MAALRLLTGLPGVLLFLVTYVPAYVAAQAVELVRRGWADGRSDLNARAG